MNAYYQFLQLTAFECVLLAIVVYGKNRQRAIGGWFGGVFLIMAFWSFGFSRYFVPLASEPAIFWAKLTLTGTILIGPFYLQGILSLLEMQRPVVVAVSFVCAGCLLALLWTGNVVATEVHSVAYFDHYIKYVSWSYPLVVLQNVLWTAWAIVLQIKSLGKLRAYKRNQVTYFLIATAITFGSTSLIIIPMEYGLRIPPFPITFLPINFALLAYVLSKARLLEINLAIGRALVYGGTLAAVFLLTLATIGLANQYDPQFLDASQTFFIIGLILVVSSVLAFALPRYASRVGQALEHKLFGGRYRYHQALSELTTEVASMPSPEELLQTIVDRIVEHMKVPRAMVFMQEDVSTDYVARARASLQSANGDPPLLADSTEVIQWLRQHKRSLVKEEAQFREAPARAAKIAEELDRIGASLCVPMILDGQLVGALAVENKLSGDMFVDRDLKLLETLCGEAALAVRYRKFEQQMFQTSKLTSLGTLAAGIAHEIRNPLSSIKTFVQLLPSRSNDPEFQAEFSKLVSTDVDRITKIVENVLSFARSSTITVSEQRIEQILEDALELIHSKLKYKKVEVVKHYGKPPVVKGDKDQLSQVFVNVLLNAVEAVPDEGGRIKITCSTSLLESPRQRRRRTPHLTVEIADNGPGIPEKIKGRLFDPFFTTKPQGTGLGLAITYKIVEVHDGFINVLSTEGQGAAFQVHLPL